MNLFSTTGFSYENQRMTNGVAEIWVPLNIIECGNEILCGTEKNC